MYSIVQYDKCRADKIPIGVYNMIQYCHHDAHLPLGGAGGQEGQEAGGQALEEAGVMYLRSLVGERLVIPGQWRAG